MPSFFKHDLPSRLEGKREKKAAEERKHVGTYRRRKPRVCTQCGESYLPAYGEHVYRTGKWCSRKCYYATVGRRPAFVQATCMQCHKAFRRTIAALKRVRHAFCSRACVAAFHTGEQSPMFRGDKDPNRGAAWNRRAEQARARDGHRCRRCGVTQAENRQKLSVDHVRPWRSFEDKELANHPDNLVSLCRSCHSYKTTTVEHAWLRGDVLAWRQWVRSLSLPSAAVSWIADAAGAPPPPPPILTNGNSDKTHCVRGHAFSQENTRVRYGKRECRTCIRLRAVARYNPTVREELAVRQVRRD